MFWIKEVEETEPLSGYSLFQAIFLFMAIIQVIAAAYLTLFGFESITDFLTVEICLQFGIQVFYLLALAEGKRPEQYYYSVEFPIKNNKIIFYVLQLFSICLLTLVLTYYFISQQFNLTFYSTLLGLSWKDRIIIMCLYIFVYGIMEEVFFRGFLPKSFPNNHFYEHVIGIFYGAMTFVECNYGFAKNGNLTLPILYGAFAYFLHFYLDYLRKMNRLSGAVLTQVLMKAGFAGGVMMRLNLWELTNILIKLHALPERLRPSATVSQKDSRWRRPDIVLALPLLQNPRAQPQRRRPVHEWRRPGTFHNQPKAGNQTRLRHSLERRHRTLNQTAGQHGSLQCQTPAE